MKIKRKNKHTGTFATVGIMATVTVIAIGYSISTINTKNIIVEEPTDEINVVEMTITTQATQQDLTVPDGDTSFKSYMDYRAITNKRSAQYKLQQKCETDNHGLRKLGDDYVIAVGSYYADYVGTRLEITLDSGEHFTAVVGDFKADSHTDDTHRYTPMQSGGKNVIEFVVDTNSLDKTARKMGDISYVDGFKGNVESICECEDSVIEV